MTKFPVSWKITSVVLVLCVATVIGSSAQTLTTLYSFTGSTDGQLPNGLVQGLDGNLYGGTGGGGINDSGTTYKFAPSGGLTVIYNYGAGYPGMILATDGNFYTIETVDGAFGGGAILKITPDGVVSTVYNFCAKNNCKDGKGPLGALIQGSEGNFYGTTTGGGTSAYCQTLNDCGTIFKLTPAGVLNTLYNFCDQPNCIDGYDPAAPLTKGSDNNLYGTTAYGGLNNFGEVFELTPNGLTTLHSFNGNDGETPVAGLTQGTGGAFYGAAAMGGTSNNCSDPFVTGCGTVYKLTAQGQFGSISFSETNGANPYALVRATDGSFYGMTQNGGSSSQSGCVRYGCGTIFRLTPLGNLTTVYTFCTDPGCPDGYDPTGTLIQDTDGNLYGTTGYGGPNHLGTIFRLSLGLAPFIKTLPTSGKAGASVFILGNNLTGASSVMFNGTPASFTVVSATEITTTVPSSATSGTVQVVTPGGTLNSNAPFHVVQ